MYVRCATLSVKSAGFNVSAFNIVQSKSVSRYKPVKSELSNATSISTVELGVISTLSNEYCVYGHVSTVSSVTEIAFSVVSFTNSLLVSLLSIVKLTVYSFVADSSSDVTVSFTVAFPSTNVTGT